MVKLSTEKPKGLLYHDVSLSMFQLARYLPSDDLSFFVERYWTVKWDLRGQPPFNHEDLPFPCVNLVIQQDYSGVFGVVTGKFSRLLEEQGRAFAIKFRPGAFHPFMKASVSRLTDQCWTLESVFGDAGVCYEKSILALDDEHAMVECAEDFLRACAPERDEMVTMVNEVVDCIIADRTITKVDDVVNQLHLNKRTVQRIFRQYVGVSPKWVIKRYRLQEALERVTSGEVVDWAKLALSLGYFDQAHFIKDFKTIIGRTPTDYAKDAAPN